MSLYLIRRNKVITMTRGDYLSIDIELKSGKFPNEKIYQINEGDIVFFGLMEPNQPFEKAILKKEFGYDDFAMEGQSLIKIVLNPEDTIELAPGTYYYQVKVLYRDESGVTHIDTAVQKTKFIIVD